jgi:hypothetical protein
MEDSPSWEANRTSASQTSHILWNLEVHHCLQKCPPPIPIHSPINLGHASSFYFFKTILILSSHLRLGLPSGSYPQVTPPKPCMHLSYLPYKLHDPTISFSQIIFSEEYRAKIFSLCTLLHSHYLIPFRPKHLLQHRIIKHSAYLSPSMWETKLYTHTKQQAKLQFCTLHMHINCVKQ